VSKPEQPSGRQAALRATCLLLLFAGTASAARAHQGSPLLDRDVLHSWTFDPWLLLIIASASFLYALGRRAQREQALPDAMPRRLENAAFVLSMLSLLLALASPLDRLSDLTFSAHMTQHELLMLLAAPLLVLARPLPTYLRGLPPGPRARAASWLRSGGTVRAFRFLSAPSIALLLHGTIRWLWHVPALFEAALANEWIHGAQHASFFLSALLFWWGLVHGRYGRAGYGLSFLFVLLTAMHTGALGALLSFSEHVWYPSYQQRALQHQVDAVSDQQVAGLIMWVGAGLWMMLLALALFLAWLGEARLSASRASTAALLRRRGAATQ
jgi:putative membrane protein